MVARIVGAVLLTLVIFHVVAFAVYAPWSAVTGLEPTAGIIAEAIYFPLAALTTKRLVCLKDSAATTVATHV